jgi:hypothetical protein
MIETDQKEPQKVTLTGPRFSHKLKFAKEQDMNNFFEYIGQKVGLRHL